MMSHTNKCQILVLNLAKKNESCEKKLDNSILINVLIFFSTQEHNMPYLSNYIRDIYSEEIEKLHELSLILKSQACAKVTQDIIFTFFSDY